MACDSTSDFIEYRCMYNTDQMVKQHVVRFHLQKNCSSAFCHWEYSEIE